jgi:hypothetical protein
MTRAEKVAQYHLALQQGTPAEYPYGGDDWVEVRRAVHKELKIKPRCEIVCLYGTRDERWHAVFTPEGKLRRRELS